MTDIERHALLGALQDMAQLADLVAHAFILMRSTQGNIQEANSIRNRITAYAAALRSGESGHA